MTLKTSAFEPILNSLRFQNILFLHNRNKQTLSPVVFNLPMRIFAVVLLCFAINPTYSQLGIKVGAVAGVSRAKSYKTFTEMYNTQNEGLLAKELNTPSLVKGFDLEADYTFNRLYGGLGLTWLFGESEAKFLNGAKRHVDLNQRHFYGVLGFIAAGDDTEFSLSGGFSLRRSFMHSYVEYPTKDRDYAVGQIWGTYSAVGIGIPLMAHVGKRITNSSWIFFKMQFQLMGVYDFSYFKGTSSTLIYSGANYFGYEILEDNKNVILEIGLKKKF